MKAQNSLQNADFAHRDGPSAPKTARWNAAQPRIDGMATYEWNVVEGTVWYSDEWRRMTKSDDYNWKRPNDGSWWTNRIHPEDLPILERSCMAMISGMVDKAEITFRFKRDDGLWRWFFWRSQVSEKDRDEKPVRMSGICIDLTDVLNESHCRHGKSSVSDFDYHSMLENSPDLFIRYDRDLNPVYSNPVVLKYIRSEKQPHVTDSRKNVAVPQKYKDFLKKNAARVFKEKTVVREEISFTLANAEDVFGECSFWPESDGCGNVIYVMAQFRDLTEQRRVEERSKLNERRLEALYRLTCMENVPDSEVLQFVLDNVLKLTSSHSGFIFIPEQEGSTKGVLYWASEDKTLRFEDYFSRDALPPELVMQFMDEHGAWRYHNINNGDGHTPLCTMFEGKLPIHRGIVAPGTENTRVVCLAGVCNKTTDYEESDLQQLETFINSAWLILNRRRVIDELRQAKETAVAANKAKNIFLANVSHELRTPLNGVLTMLQLVDSASLTPRQQEYISIAQSSGRALLRIISDILDLSSMESGKMPLTVDVFDCRETIRSALVVFVDDAARKGLEFTCHIDDAFPQYLLGDGERVRQIIFNLAGNALKYTEKGGITVHCAYIPEGPQGKTGISLVVSDTGIGIPATKLATIFDAFTQVENKKYAKCSGAGLGLSIVKHLTAMMHGTVTVESVHGVGTTFRCSLFFDEVPKKQVAAIAAMQHLEERFSRPLDILVAEDDAVSSFALRAFLQHAGNRVLCVENGKLALEALQMYPFDCLFTDITMPCLDGLELVRHIRSGLIEKTPPSEEIRELVQKTFPNAPRSPGTVDPAIVVVAVTAHTMLGDKERFLGQGMDYYISKPIIRRELNGVLTRIGLSHMDSRSRSKCIMP